MQAASSSAASRAGYVLGASTELQVYSSDEELSFQSLSPLPADLVGTAEWDASDVRTTPAICASAAGNGADNPTVVSPFLISEVQAARLVLFELIAVSSFSVRFSITQCCSTGRNFLCVCGTQQSGTHSILHAHSHHTHPVCTHCKHAPIAPRATRT